MVWWFCTHFASCYLPSWKKVIPLALFDFFAHNSCCISVTGYHWYAFTKGSVKFAIVCEILCMELTVYIILCMVVSILIIPSFNSDNDWVLRGKGMWVFGEKKQGWNLLPTVYKHIEAETKWMPFRGWLYQVHFLELKCLNSDQNFTEVCL